VESKYSRNLGAIAVFLLTGAIKSQKRKSLFNQKYNNPLRISPKLKRKRSMKEKSLRRLGMQLKRTVVSK